MRILGRKARKRPQRERRRLRLRPQNISRVLFLVGSRDNWICWICEEEVCINERATDLLTRPTKDHLIPQVLGGPDGLWNLRICHYKCNWSRRDNEPPPRAELLKHVDSTTYPLMVERFRDAYDFDFAAHERVEP